MGEDRAEEQAGAARVEGVGDEQRGVQVSCGHDGCSAASFIDRAFGRRIIQRDHGVWRKIGRRDAGAIELDPGSFETVSVDALVRDDDQVGKTTAA